MESSDTINEFVGSTAFTILIVVALIAVGFTLRATFRSHDVEYKHKPED